MTTATREDLEALLTDSRYALRQCRDHRDPARAADALERVEERLDRLIAEAELAEIDADDGPSARDLEEMHALADAYRQDFDDDDLPF